MVMSAFIAGSCTYDSAGELACSTSNVTYSVTITDILRNNSCYGCHGTPLSGGAPFGLDSYQNLIAHKDRLLGAISHAPGFAPMPRALPQMSAFEISRVKAWLDAGAPEN